MAVGDDRVTGDRVYRNLFQHGLLAVSLCFDLFFVGFFAFFDMIISMLRV